MSSPPITHTESFLVMHDRVRLLARHEQTAGAFLAIEVQVAPGGGPPPLHTHPAAELFWTLSGRLSYFREDPGGISEITGGPGTSAFIPGGVPHTYRNFGDEPASYLGILSPGRQMQEFLLAAGIAPEDEPRTPEEVLAIGERYGLVTLPVVPAPRR
jgi:mannose-6-phosphate isomerase-like protein (cupin superfamily)